MAHDKGNEGATGGRRARLDDDQSGAVSERHDLAGSTGETLPDETHASGASKEERAGNQNPPRTTTGKITAPKFGSAGSGGAELEPGPERD